MSKARETESDRIPDRVTSVCTEQGVFTVHSAGAQITKWDSAEFGPILFTSTRSRYGVGRTVRGGVPICFPWFGSPTQTGISSEPAERLGPVLDQKHGYGRQLPWDLVASEKSSDGGWNVHYQLTDTAVQRAGLEPSAPFFASYKAWFSAKQLHLELEVTNPGSTAFTYEEALHTYFRVADVGQVRVEGLEGVEHADATLPERPLYRDSTPIRFTSTVDRIYHTTMAPVIIDPSFARSIRIESVGSGTTIVWNPGADNSVDFEDLGPMQWLDFVCVETANAGPDAITLLPGQSHTLAATYLVSHIEENTDD